ncbi:hypothetical protein RJT34_12412 [Clitoria ternatea]|uniref:Cyclotide n=1 Tax=Clitoria ternatea TaxID=43366 RepID=A0AAN9JNV9_CLITE
MMSSPTMTLTWASIAKVLLKLSPTSLLPQNAFVEGPIFSECYHLKLERPGMQPVLTTSYLLAFPSIVAR